MQLEQQGDELITYRHGRRIVLDVLTIEHIRDRLISDRGWRPKIAQLAAVCQFNINRMPLDETLLNAYNVRLVTLAPALLERVVG